jgi:hypothetical protein
MDIIVQRIALGFAFGSFFFMVIGSMITGATALTAFIRGFEGAAIFGSIAWLVASYLFKEEDIEVDDPMDME